MMHDDRSMAMVREAASIDASQPTRGRRKRLVVGLLCLGLLVLAAIGYRWWTHPDLFPDAGDGFQADPVPLSRSTLHVGVVFPPVSEPGRGTTTVTIRAAGARFAENSAQALVAFSVCRFSGDPIGFVRGDLGRFCEEVRPVAGDATFRYGPDDNEVVVMTLVPTRPGTTHVDGIWLDYATDASHQWRHGVQDLRLNVTVEAR